MKKIVILSFPLLLLNIQCFPQSSWGILGAFAGEIIKGTSKKDEWKTIGKAIQIAGAMQYGLDKAKIENTKDVTIRKEVTYNLSTFTYKRPDEKISPAKGYEWKTPLSSKYYSV